MPLNRSTNNRSTALKAASPPSKLCFLPPPAPDSEPAPSMARAVSMLEMNEIQQMERFGATMDSLDVAAPQPQPQDDDSDDFLFIDSGDTLDELDKPGDKPVDKRVDKPVDKPSVKVKDEPHGITDAEKSLSLKSSRSPDSVTDASALAAAPAPAAKPLGGMRRVMSLASLSTVRASKFGLSSRMGSAHPDIHTIQEHGDSHSDHDGLGASADHGDLNLNDDDAEDELNSSVHSKLWVGKHGKDSSQASNSDANGDANARRPSRRRGGGLGRLGSSLKGSSTSLRRLGSSNGLRRLGSRGSSNNLRNSGTSFASCSSNLVGSIDDANHSLDSTGSDEDEDDNNDAPPAADVPSAVAVPSAVKLKRNVSFSSLEIRNYHVTLSDAPTTNGPGVGLSWEYDLDATEDHCIDAFEKERFHTRRTRREMHMPAQHRQWLLMREAGCTRTEIMAAAEEAQRVKKGRERTAQGVRLGFVPPIELALERARRSITRRG